MSQIKTVGFIGTGIMGAQMAGHLQRAGWELQVYNRTKEKAQKLLDGGARWCQSPADAADGADAVFTIVGFPRDVESVILGENGVLSSASAGTIVVDMTTSEPALARRIYQQAKAKGVGSLDAPVSGGDVGARQATLAIMVGGDREDFQRVRPLLETMGKTVRHIGPAGAGQHCKMVNQILITGVMTGMAEAFTYGLKAGLDMETVLGVVGSGAAGSAGLSALGPRVLKGDFEPGFIIEHYIKDMAIALAEAEAMGLDLPGLALTKRRYEQAAASGLARKGTQALCKAVAEKNGLRFGR
ncbi:MAG: NAD(P)-dependent oxidoreductase [Planctomycetes bacterium]|nr:NAD(P)-dependent oxidoreductase [Planctomycetota bacterium]